MALIDTLKTYPDITWDDEHTNAKLSGILSRAQAKMCAYAGADLTFDDGTDEQQLLLDLCRYVWFNVPENFEENYKHDLLMLRAKYKVEAMPDDEETDTTG